MSPPRLCIGCSRNVAIAGTSRCPDCTTSGWQVRRLPGADVNYRGNWPIIRKAQLKREPNCRVCGRPATVADHILNQARGGTHDPSNLQSLCTDCSRTKTAHEGHEGRRLRSR